MVSTSEAKDLHIDILKKTLNVEHIEFSLDREFSSINPDKITARTCDGKAIGEDKHYCVHAKWIVNGKKYQGLVPIETKKCSKKFEIIPFFWSTETEWEDPDDLKMFDHLREMIESSRKY